MSKKVPTVADRYAEAFDEAVNAVARMEARTAAAMVVAAFAAERALVERGTLPGPSADTLVTLHTAIVAAVDKSLSHANMPDEIAEREKTVGIFIDAAVKVVVGQTIAMNAE